MTFKAICFKFWRLRNIYHQKPDRIFFFAHTFVVLLLSSLLVLCPHLFCNARFALHGKMSSRVWHTSLLHLSSKWIVQHCQEREKHFYFLPWHLLLLLQSLLEKRRVVHICQIIWIMRHFEWYFNTVQNSCLKIFLKYFSKYWTIGNLHHSCFCSNVLRFLQLFSMELKSCCLALLCVHNCLKIHKNPPKCTCINNFTWVLLVVRLLPSK